MLRTVERIQILFISAFGVCSYSTLSQIQLVLQGFTFNIYLMLHIPLEKCVYLLSHWELDEEIDTILINVSNWLSH